MHSATYFDVHRIASSFSERVRRQIEQLNIIKLMVSVYLCQLCHKLFTDLSILYLLNNLFYGL